jgi:hypothetical protein
MGGNVARNCNQDVTPRRAATPLPILLHASLKHLIGMEFGVLAQHRAGKRGDQGLHRMPEAEITGNEASGRLNSSLAIERRKKGIAQFSIIARQVVELIVAFAWKACW